MLIGSVLPDGLESADLRARCRVFTDTMACGSALVRVEYFRRLKSHPTSLEDLQVSNP